MHCHRIASSALFAICVGAISIDICSAGTLVQVNTSLGNFKLKLNDEVAPATVANFLKYVTDGDYSNTIIHRSVPSFIVQGGGYTTNIQEIPSDPPVMNEFNLPNAQGTIAMAKLGGDPNSATSEWFVSLEDNRENLDNQNGGFTVFGHVIEGMNVVNDIGHLPRFNFGGAFSETPLRNYTEADYNNDVNVTTNHLVVVQSVQTIGDWTPAWNNPNESFDTNNDGVVIPQDLLVLIDAFHRSSFRELDGPLVGAYFIDVNQNGAFDVDDIDRTANAFRVPAAASSGFLSLIESSELLSLVPEPSGALLGALSAAVICAIRRRQRLRVDY